MNASDGTLTRTLTTVRSFKVKSTSSARDLRGLIGKKKKKKKKKKFFFFFFKKKKKKKKTSQAKKSTREAGKPRSPPRPTRVAHKNPRTLTLSF